MTAVSSSSVCDGVEGGRLLAHPRPERLGALDRRVRRRVGGDQEEVLAAVGLGEAVVPGLADRQLVGALEAEVGLRVGVVEVVGHLAPLEQHVERHHRRAGLEDAVVDDREVRQVGAAERHLVAGLDAALDQEVGHLVGGAVHLGVGQSGVAEHDGVAVGVLVSGVLEQAGQVQHSANLVGGTPATEGHPHQRHAEAGDDRTDDRPLRRRRSSGSPRGSRAPGAVHTSPTRIIRAPMPAASAFITVPSCCPSSRSLSRT